MNKIGIVTEIAADLPQSVINDRQIGIVSVGLDWPEANSMPGENIFQKMREIEKKGITSFGKTSQPSPKAFLDVFKDRLQLFEEIICVTITSKLSGTKNSALQAVKFLPAEDQKRVFVVDSLNASGGEALLILKGFDLIEQGKKTKDIIKELEDFIPSIHLLLMLKDVKWMEASGRISHLTASLLKRMAAVGIRPLLAFKKGLLVPAGIKMKAKDITETLFHQFERAIEKGKAKDAKIRVVINHGDSFAQAEKLKNMIESSFKNAKVEFATLVNNVVGVLVGPDSLICSWYIN